MGISYTFYSIQAIRPYISFSKGKAKHYSFLNRIFYLSCVVKVESKSSCSKQLLAKKKEVKATKRMNSSKTNSSTYLYINQKFI